MCKSQDYDSEHIWKILLMFECLILSPSLHTNKNSKKGPSLHQLIRSWLRLFRTGQLSDLYKESWVEVVSKSASYYRENPPPVSKSAQNAANDNSSKSPWARLTKNTPIAPTNNSTIPTCCKLSPRSWIWTFPEMSALLEAHETNTSVSLSHLLRYSKSSPSSNTTRR